MRHILLVLIIAACLVMTWQYIVNWHTIHGLVYNLLDDREAAGIKFRTAIEKDPNNIYAQFYLGHLLFEDGDYDSAILHLRKVEQLVPTHHKTQYLLGISLAAQDQMESAIAALVRANKLNPGTAQYQFQLGLLYKTAANYPQALTALNAAADNGKQDEELYLNRGYVYLGLDQPVKARQQFQLVLEHQPDNFLAQYEISTTLQVTGQLDEAYQALEKARQLNPGYPHLHKTYFSLGIAFKEKQMLTTSIKLLSTAIVLTPAIADYHYQLGLLYKDSDKPQDAVTALKKAASLDVDSEYINTALGYALLETGNPAMALNIFQKIVTINPRHPHAHAGLAKIYVVQNRTDDAINEFQIDIEISPDKFFSHYGIGLLYKNNHQLLSAKTHLEKAAMLDPKYPYTCKQLREIYTSLDNAAKKIPHQIITNCNL